MRFDSAEFLFFFIAVLVLHRTLPWKRPLLLVASFGFYASWNPPFLLLLLASTGLDYTVGRRLERAERPGRRRALLLASVLGNLGILAYFKYVNFFLGILTDSGAASAEALQPFYIQTEIPLGISFYTFQTLGYSIDVYRRQIKACESLWDFALFVSFFPQLIAGPIVRAAELLPQINANRNADARQTLDGLALCLVGLFKKVVVADTFALLADRCFAAPHLYSGGALLVATFAFSCQIYCDFSGYSTMARGLAQLLGYHLPQNFTSPYLAGNPIDYRRSWHITMGNWFRDYVYRPLGGDRHGTARMIFNTMLTWTAFGFWHGASWSFLVWGFYNGLLLTGYRLLRARNWLPQGRIATLGGFVLMPLFIVGSHIFFRATSTASALTILGRIGSAAPGAQIHPGWAIALVGLYAFHWLTTRWRTEALFSRVGWPQRLAFVTAMLAALYLLGGSGEPFYYFQF